MLKLFKFQGVLLEDHSIIQLISTAKMFSNKMEMFTF